MPLPLVTQTVTIDDLDTAIKVDTRYTKDDYGVPNSPVFYTMGDLSLADNTVQLFGVTVKSKDLPKELIDRLLELAYECIDENAWDVYDYD